MDIELRLWQLSDLSILSELANNSKIAAFMTDAFPHPYSEEDGKKFIEFARSHNPVRIFAIWVNNELAGGIGLHPATDISRKNAELGYWIAEPYWGKGIASRAVTEIIRRGFEMFDVARIYARPFGHNLASRRVLEKCGFVKEATIKDGFFKNGKFYDEIIYAIRRNGSTPGAG